MWRLILLSVCLFAVSNCHHHKNATEMESVVPDVVDKVPEGIIDLTYNKEDAVHFGTELTPTKVKDQPAVSWDANPDSYYTLAMVDPDAPSRKDPKFKEVNHWLVTNILGKDIKTGDVITAYLGSGPPKGTGLHRYVFLLFKQPKKLEFDEPKTEALSREHRLNFDIKKFAKKHDLGEPIAINFFKAQWDSYVDERNKKIKNKNE